MSDTFPMRLTEATDRWMGELARRGRMRSTRDLYRTVLDGFADQHDHKPVQAVTRDDCRRFLDRWTNAEPSTLAGKVTVLAGFFGWLHEEGVITVNPMDRVRRPRVKRADELAVVTVSGPEVSRMLAVCQTWQEYVCLSVLVYTGPRLSAAARLRWADVDLEQGTARFREKGGKTIVKPLPDELVAILQASLAGDPDPDEYVIPNVRGRWKDRTGDRNPKVVWSTVRRVAERAGVRAHTHALRAAFACHYLDTHEGDTDALRHLLGHARHDTTAIYLRRQDKLKAMGRVRDLSWSNSPVGVFDQVTPFPPRVLSEPLRLKLASLSRERVSRK